MKVLKYNKTVGILSTILGIMLSISIGGIILGILFLIIGIVMIGSKKEIWYCNSCKSVIDRRDNSQQS
ncbi:MAG: hypothetical protein HQK49_04780 [Oligoflexia bacterium]|nr:hypothetical protein [Oligoflexia bacterium]